MNIRKSTFFILLLGRVHHVLADGCADKDGYCQASEEVNWNCKDNPKPLPNLRNICYLDHPEGKKTEMIGGSDSIINFFACGAQLRIAPRTANIDNVAVSGLKIKFCPFDRTSNEVTTKVIDHGYIGEWGDMEECIGKRAITGVQVMHQTSPVATSRFHDNVSIAGLRIQCQTRKGKPPKWIDINKRNSDTFRNHSEWKEEIKFGGKVLAAGVWTDLALREEHIHINSLMFEIMETTRTSWEQFSLTEGKVKMSWTDTKDVDAALATVRRSISFQEELYPPGIFPSEWMRGSFNVDEIVEVFEYPKCNPGDTLWQWRMERAKDKYGPGFECWSYHFICSDSPPRCPYGFCKDKHCQECQFMNESVIGDESEGDSDKFVVRQNDSSNRFGQDGVTNAVGFGRDIWTTADSFYFLHTQVDSTNFEIIVYTYGFISGVDNNDNNRYAKFALIVRDGLDPGSKSYAVALNHLHFLETVYRSDDNALSETKTNKEHKDKGWLKIVRNGNEFSGFYKENEFDEFAIIGTSTTINMPNNVQIGVGVSNHHWDKRGEGAGVKFSNFQFNPSA